MNLWLRVTALISLLIGVVTLFRPPLGWWSLLFWPVKLLTESLTAVAALLGGVTGLLGWRRGDRLSAVTGAAAAAVSLGYVRRVTRPRDPLAAAFGPNWPERIPRRLRGALLPRRWMPLWWERPLAHWQRNVVISEHDTAGYRLLADVWTPPDDVPRSRLGIIFLHGGGWRYGRKDMFSRHFFRHLAGQGHVVVDLAYTLYPRAGMPGMVADAHRAVAWLKQNAAQLGVDPERVVLMGGSAGAQLALLAAYAPHEAAFWPENAGADPAVHAVVSYYGPSDFRALQQAVEARYGRFADNRLVQRALDGLDWFFKWLSGVPAEANFGAPLRFIASVVEATPASDYALVSPLSYVNGHCPPTLLIQPEHDFAGLTPDVERLHEALRRAGVPVALITVPDTEHAFDLVLPQITAATQSVTYDVDRFLALMAAD